MLCAAVAALMAAPAPARGDTDTMKSETIAICSSPGGHCIGQPKVTFFPQRGSVSVAYRPRGYDADRYSIRFSVEIRNETRCRLYEPGIYIEHGDNTVFVDGLGSAGSWVEPRERRESRVTEFVMSEEASRRLESAELKYTLSLSDCED
jgi:hypothetical protein